MVTRLCVNVDHVATLRQARLTDYPDPVTAAHLAELGGADGIVIHLREDRRHIQERDLEILRRTVKTHLNLEMALTEEMIGIALRYKPDMVTLVPEKRQELTTEGGLDVKGNLERVKEGVERLKDGGIPVSIFIDPDEGQIEAAKEAGASIVEIHTGRYSDAKNPAEVKREFERIKKASFFAKDIGLTVSAGHGLSYTNVKPIAALRIYHELNIGHSIISMAVFKGIEEAVREMKRLIYEAISMGG